MEIGYFNDQAKEYIITNMYPKRPLMNFIWNEQEMIDIDHFGFGKNSIYDENRFRRELMPDTANRHVYIFDNDNGSYYAANRNYTNLPFKRHETHVGQGYSTIVSEYNDLETSLTIFSPIYGRAECWEIKLRNLSNSKKNLSVFTTAQVITCITGHEAYIRTEFNQNLSGLISTEHGYMLPTEYTDCYMASDYPIAEYEVATDRFIGHYNSAANPISLENGGILSCEGSCFDGEQTFALKHNVMLEAEQECIIRVIVGLAKNVDEAIEEKTRLLSEKSFYENRVELKKRTEQYDDRIYIKTGEEDIDRFVNIWLKRQIDLGKTWARGYVVGSRDAMQDVTSFVQLDTVVSREKLLFAMEFVRPNGNIMRAFIPVMRNISHDCSSWLITAVCQYIKESGDISILDVDCPYFECEEHGTVLDHIIRASNFLLDTLGEHGLVLWGECDWNDSLNGCGVLMKGESVWLSQASVKCNSELIELLSFIGRDDLVKSIRLRRDALAAAIIKHGWEKDHFIYGFNDHGEKVGSYEAPDGNSYLNPQTWAVLSNVLPSDKLNNLMDYVEDNLCCDFGYVQVTPAHRIGNDNLGRSSYFQPGCYENGSVYNHGCAFKIVADCYLKRGNEALKAVRLMLPTNPKNSSENSGMEPYAISNMYLGPEAPHRVGYSPMHWISGTCGWLFRGIVEYMLGIQADYNGLKIDPALPEKWKNITAHRTYRNCSYDIAYEQKRYNGEVKILVDGKTLVGNILPYFTDNQTHQVKVTIE